MYPVAVHDSVLMPFLSSADTLYAMLKTDGTIVYISDAAEALLGYPEKELLPAPLMQIVHPAAFEKVAAALLEVAEKGEIKDAWLLVHKGGKAVPFAVRALSAGEYIYVTLIVQEQHPLSSIEGLLRENRNTAILASMCNTLPILLWGADTNRQSYFVNEPWLQEKDTQFPSVLEGNWLADIHPEDRERVTASFNAAFDRQLGFKEEYRFITGENTCRWLLTKAMPYHNGLGEFMGYIGTCVDITDFKEMEERFRKSEERFYLAISGTKDGIWDWNTVTNEIYFSPRWKEMLGYADDELQDETSCWERLLHPDDKEQTIEERDRYVRGETKTYSATFRMRHKSGTWRWILSRATALRDHNGKVYRMVGAHTDLTLYKEMEEQLRIACEKAEAASRAKSEFLANMSHEMRTPMNAVVGLSNVLMGTALSGKQKEYVNMLKLSANSLLALINDLLDVERIESNTLELENISFNLLEVIEDAIQLVSVKAHEKGIELFMHYQAFGDLHFVGDPLRIRQIILNLIDNGIKFTEKGRVVVQLNVTPHPESRMADISIGVSDSGIGIAERQLTAIFEKFTQADASTTRQYGGSGLGLAICMSLTKLMGGEITVESELGKGSCFTLNLPLQLSMEDACILRAEAEIRIAPTIIKPGGAKNTILLVEDYHANVLVACTLLEGFGYSYEVAYDGKEALEKLAINDFSLILMDVQMREMDGYETTRIIRELERKHSRPRIPIIGVTAHALAGDREKCLRAGMDEYIAKPYNPVELQTKLSQLLNIFYAGYEKLEAEIA